MIFKSKLVPCHSFIIKKKILYFAAYHFGPLVRKPDMGTFLCFSLCFSRLSFRVFLPAFFDVTVNNSPKTDVLTTFGFHTSLPFFVFCVLPF